MPAPLTEPHSGSDTVSEKQSAQVEDETNEKHIFQGRVASEPYYRERRSGKPIADFILAEHPSDGETVFHRIRAFGKQAEKVRDRMAKGQAVDVTAYGTKQ